MVFKFDKRFLTHFDMVIPSFILPLMGISYLLISETNQFLANKQLFYFMAGIFVFIFFVFMPIRRFLWLIPFGYWLGIFLLLMVDFFGVTKLGATRWLEIPFVHFTIQPSEIIKPIFLLMIAYLVSSNPPPPKGYGLKSFLKLSIYIIIPFLLILKEPDLGTALILLIVGYALLFMIGVYWKIWATIFTIIIILSPIMYNNLHSYQKKRINDFLSEEPSYHVQQSIIAIGSGGIWGKKMEDATQTQLKFLPIATSDFIFASYVERSGFLGATFLILLYILLIFHLLFISIKIKKDYLIKIVSLGITFILFLYMSINIAMVIGLAPVVGVPLPMFSYGGSSFLMFMALFGVLEHLLAFRFLYLYDKGRAIIKRK